MGPFRVAAAAAAALLSLPFSPVSAGSSRGPKATSASDPFGCSFLTNDGISCMLPFPDNFFLSTTWNASAPPRLVLGPNTLPQDGEGVGIDPAAGGWNDLQGFSPLGPYVAFLAGLSLDLSGLPRLWNISSSVGASANSVILDTVTGKPVMHWAEIDHSGDGSSLGEEPVTIVWPAARLLDSRRYVVALRRLVDDDGAPLLPSDGFAALRDKVPTSNPALEASRPRFEAIFAQLSSALGWARADLTLAWDFTTNTQVDITSRMLHMRDDAMQRISALPGGVPYNITSVQNNVDANTTRRIHGQFFVPCYLPDRAIPSLHSKLVLDPVTALPVFQEFVPFDFEVVIPPSVAQRVASGGAPGKVLTYGHGLFGDHGEVEEGYLSLQAQAEGWVLAATDWIGLSEYDEATVAVMLITNFTDFAIVPDRLHQGMLNTLVLARLVGQSDFQKDAAMTYGGNTVSSSDPADWVYTGNSQGGIMGGMYMAASGDVTRGVMGVTGGPYTLLLPRSTDFSTLFDVLKARYPRSADRIGVLAAIQALWDRADPAGWVSYISQPLPNTPPHRVIIHYGEGDAQVTWLGAQTLALSAGAVIFETNVLDGNQSMAHFTHVPDDAVLTTGNALVGFDYGFPLVPFINVPPSDGVDAHECPRRTGSAQAQMAHFFSTGEIINTCGVGGCVQPPPPGCG